MAYIAYEDAYHTHKSHSHDTRRQYAISIAQQIEHQAINTANLSIQELIDCDTRYDQGCSGGNPLLAFYFLHKFGVTSAHNYPYTGHDKDTCRYRKMDEPVATVKSWGIMTADHENNIEKVCLLYFIYFLLLIYDMYRISFGLVNLIPISHIFSLTPSSSSFLIDNENEYAGITIHWSSCCWFNWWRSSILILSGGCIP
jgi:hypothetical protein